MHGFSPLDKSLNKFCGYLWLSWIYMISWWLQIINCQQNRHFLDLDLHFIIIIFQAISYEKKARDLHTYSSIGRKSYQWDVDWKWQLQGINIFLISLSFCLSLIPFTYRSSCPLLSTRHARLQLCLCLYECKYKN